MMNMTLHGTADHTAVTRYGEDGITVNETHFEGAVIVHPEREPVAWPVASIAALTVDQAKRLLDHEPEVVLIGTGAAQVFPEHAVIRAFLQRGVGCEIMDTGAACRTFNVLASEGRQVVAALLPL